MLDLAHLNCSCDSVDCNVERVDVEVGILVEVLEQKVDMGAVAGDAVEALHQQPLRLDELDATA